MEKLFEKAAREKLRFSTAKGQLAVEDLYDLSLQSLDTIAKGVNKQLKDASEESFISKRSSTDKELELKLEILKHVIKVKMDEADASKVRAEKRAKLERLKEIQAQKSGEAMNQLSQEEINKQIEELSAELA